MSIQLSSIYKSARAKLSNIKGQGLVEYALILVLIAIVVITAVTAVGTKTNSTFNAVQNAMH